MTSFYIFRIQSKEPVVLEQAGNLGYFIFIINHCSAGLCTVTSLQPDHTGLFRHYWMLIKYFNVSNRT